MLHEQCSQSYMTYELSVATDKPIFTFKTKLMSIKEREYLSILCQFDGTPESSEICVNILMCYVIG